MLLQVLKGLGPSRKPGASAPVQAAPRAFSAAAEALAARVLSLCESGDRELAYVEAMSKSPMPATTTEAEQLVRRVFLPLLEACLRHGDASVACRVEASLYGNLAKRFEDPRHVATCLGIVESCMHQLGALARLEMTAIGEVRRLLFFVHNLGTDYAHTLLLCDLIDAYLQRRPHEAKSIGIAGVVGETVSPAVGALIERWELQVHPYKTARGLHQPLNKVAQLLVAGRYDRLVVVSVPVGISYLTGLLPRDRVGWLTMKYQLPCFEHLAHRCSFRSGLRREQLVDGKRWLQAAPLFNGNTALEARGDLAPVLRQARKSGVVIYTINREEKIRNLQFLHRVARILRSVDDAVFVWTGRQRLAEIDAFFDEWGLGKRHLFAGWVVPDDLMQTGDLFLDTPVLSGNVAARATALGLPVLSDGDAITWVGTFLPAYEADRGTSRVAALDALIAPLEAQGISLQCKGDDDYVRQAVLLARDAGLRHRFGRALEAFARHYFFDAGRAAEDHFANLRAPVN